MDHYLLLMGGWVFLLVLLIVIALIVFWLLRTSKAGAAEAIALSFVLGILGFSFDHRIDILPAVLMAETEAADTASAAGGEVTALRGTPEGTGWAGLRGVTAHRCGGTAVAAPMCEGTHA